MAALNRIPRFVPMWLALIVLSGSPLCSRGSDTFTKSVRKEVSELFFVPTSKELCREDPESLCKEMVDGDPWLEFVEDLVGRREIEFRVENVFVSSVDAADQKSAAESWKKKERSGVVLRKFRDRSFNWILIDRLDEYWMAITFELLNLNEFESTEGPYKDGHEAIEAVARSEYKVMKKANGVFHERWAPYCKMIGADAALYAKPWFEENLAVGEEVWIKLVLVRPEFDGYRKAIVEGAKDLIKQ